MAPGLEIANANALGAIKDEVSQLEYASQERPVKRTKFAGTKDFTAAAEEATSFTSQQLQQNDDNLLQASPYSEREHLLDLTTLAEPLQLFAKALTNMRWITQDYATAPYPGAFNWDSIVDAFSSTLSDGQREAMPEKLHFYVIVFRSRVNEHADRQLLGQLDKAAHIEAVEGGGLLKYWFGTPNEVGRNLATCIWRDRADARRGGAGPGHAQAMKAAARMYNEWYVERLRMTVGPKDGSWSFETWTDDQVTQAG